MTIEELRARCIEELYTHEQYYETIKSEMDLDLIDDESLQNHVRRIINNQQYTGVLTFAALSNEISLSILKYLLVDRYEFRNHQYSLF